MDSSDWTFRNKPYDIRRRLTVFATAVTRLSQFLHTHSPVARELWPQLLLAANSAAANYEEVDDGSSARDRSAKRRIVLRELKETRVRLRVLRDSGILTAAQDPVLEEAEELIKIVAVIIKKTAPP